MANEPLKQPHVCRCLACVTAPNGAVAQEHALINRLVILLDEKVRRRFVGLLAQQRGYGGIQQMAEITGLHRHTIARGLDENQSNVADDVRIRQAGGGRKQLEKKNQRCWRN